MEHFYTVTLDLISQFIGGRGGIDHIVQFGMAAIFWGVLLILALLKRRRADLAHETLLAWGFGLGLARELFMLFMSALQAYGIVSAEDNPDKMTIY